MRPVDRRVAGPARSRVEVLGELREEFNAASTARVRLGDGARRLVAYAFVAPGESPVVALAAARRYAEREGHRVIREFADATGPLDPRRRPGYLEARRLVSAGYAEGLVVRSMQDISIDLDEYELEIRDLGEKSALVLLERPEESR
ncbi:hypothetical protein AB0469_37945 [Streptomyces sp. NPDC093801]|uniref:hypothetical protein n=1 Tax=Streptomyces sp. NPDC093801 TaxID=3155203 RepID=UPI00344F2066